METVFVESRIHSYYTWICCTVAIIVIYSIVLCLAVLYLGVLRLDVELVVMVEEWRLENTTVTKI